MNDLNLPANEMLLPALPNQALSDIEALTSALGIPRDVLASDEEISSAWADLPRELRAIPHHLRGELGESLARMCVAVRAGLFDGAISYIWNAAILNLRQRMRDFGLPAVSQILERPYEESHLVEQQDSQTIELCLKLNLITEDGFFFLDQCRATRNNFSSAHPAMGKINDREFIIFFNRCTRYAFTHETPLVGVDFSEFMSAIRGRRFTDNQREVWVDRLNATHDPQRQLLFGTLHGIYCDPASPEESRLNALDLCVAYQPKLTTAIKSDLIDRHSEYLAKGDDQRHRASQQLFEKLGLLVLLNDSERHSVISGAVRQLWSVHLGMNNFYNEPPFAERLMRLSGVEAIPDTIQEQFVETVVSCYIGNGYGVSNAAVQYYETMIRSFSPKEIACLISAGQGNSTVAQRVKSNSLCRSRLKDALGRVDPNSIPASLRTDYDRLAYRLSHQ